MKRALLALLLVIAAFVLVIPTPFTGVLPLIRLPVTTGSRAGPQAGAPATFPTLQTARHLLLITIDTLRADHVGVYGGNASTPALNGLAERGVRFTHAYATAPITLTSHASLLTGRYPPGHGARHNGIAMMADVPTLATFLRSKGFETAAFVSAFPLDRRFGLDRGFGVYDDEMPRGADRRPLNERPGATTVDRAIAWLKSRPDARRFVWVHLFEPHAPYGQPSPANEPRPAIQRYDDEIAVADREIARLLRTWGSLDDTLVVAAGDHGEAFGEHGEVGHSIFVYDTTLRVPLILAGGPIEPRQVVVEDPVALIDVAPTVVHLLGLSGFDADGLSVQPAFDGGRLPERALYAESFAPLLDFGWAPLRSLRENGMKLIAAPRSELYGVPSDPGEETNIIDARRDVARDLTARIDRISGTDLPTRSTAPVDPDAAARLRALGYAGMGGASSSATRPDPKDRISIASRIAAVTSGELQGAAVERALVQVLDEDPRNPQAHLRLGFVFADSGRCAAAEPHFTAAIASGVPSADPYLGLAACQRARGADAAALGTLAASRQIEPRNPVVEANIGLIELDTGRADRAIPSLTRAIDIDPDLHEARFALARALARTGRRAEALQQATDLLARLPAAAPQRPEVERLVAALR